MTSLTLNITRILPDSDAERERRVQIGKIRSKDKTRKETCVTSIVKDFEKYYVITLLHTALTIFHWL